MLPAARYCSAMNTAVPASTDRHYATAARAIAWLQAHAAEQPSLEALAAALHLSPDHLQRVFLAWAGVSPKRFVQYLSKEHALARLREGDTVLAASHSAGLSGPGRLHDLLVRWQAVTPGEVRAWGSGLTVHSGWGDTPFGPALIGWTDRGVCHLVFETDGRDAHEHELQQHWPLARHTTNPTGAQRWLQHIFVPEHATEGRQPLPLLLCGSAFQLQVWQALLRLPSGHVVSYQALAQAAGRPGASRAVGSAMAANTLGYLMPCHRVLRGSGESGHYRWGPERKLALLGWEAARRDTASGSALSP